MIQDALGAFLMCNGAFAGPGHARPIARLELNRFHLIRAIDWQRHTELYAYCWAAAVRKRSLKSCVFHFGSSGTGHSSPAGPRMQLSSAHENLSGMSGFLSSGDTMADVGSCILPAGERFSSSSAVCMNVSSLQPINFIELLACGAHASFEQWSNPLA